MHLNSVYNYYSVYNYNYSYHYSSCVYKNCMHIPNNIIIQGNDSSKFGYHLNNKNNFGNCLLCMETNL